MDILKLIILILASPFTHATDEICPPQPPWTQPAIPDGFHASKEEMLNAQVDVTAYVRGIEQWNVCNPYVHGLQSGRMLRRAREVADVYNAELREFLSQQRNTSKLASSEKRMRALPDNNKHERMSKDSP